MMKAMIATALLALVGVSSFVPAAAAQGPGICAGICVEVTKVDPAETDIQNVIQTCAGNVNVQVGIDNTANYCTGGNNTNGDGFS